MRGREIGRERIGERESLLATELFSMAREGEPRRKRDKWKRRKRRRRRCRSEESRGAHLEFCRAAEISFPSRED